MTLRIDQIGNTLPFQYIVDPTAEFEAGMVAQLNNYGNQITCGVSDGTAPFGIIDDVRTRTFHGASVDEVVIVPATGIISNGVLVTPIDILKELKYPNISPKSFFSDIEVELIPTNGVITIPALTPLNFSAAGNGPDSIRVIVSYVYQVANVPAEDTTMGSGRVTVWFQRMIFHTDQFETNQRYPLNANLFVSECGLLTTRMCFSGQPSVGLVQAPPTSVFEFLGALWL